jgi:tRNA (guanine-N7-)-methyltransferase
VLDFAKIFSNTHDVVLEIGFGNGDTLVEMAQANPALNYVGIEVYEAGIGRLINSAHIKQLNNLKVMRGDAVEFLSANIADNSLARFQLFFPDPWHKKNTSVSPLPKPISNTTSLLLPKILVKSNTPCASIA